MNNEEFTYISIKDKINQAVMYSNNKTMFKKSKPIPKDGKVIKFPVEMKSQIM
jgi:hypothetical protein